MLDPASLEGQDLLNRLGVSYEEYIFYFTSHGIGMKMLLACLIIAVYDVLTTLEEEIQYIWKMGPKLSLAKLMFILNRYLPPITYTTRFYYYVSQTPENPMCNGIANPVAYFTMINVASIEMILAMRVWVLWGRSRVVAGILIVLLLGGLGTCLLMRFKTPHMPWVVQFPPVTLTLCRRDAPAELFGDYVTALVCETTVFGMMAWNVIERWRERITLSTPVVQTLLTQGLLWYSIVTAAFATALFATTQRQMLFPFLDSNIFIALACIACNHLILGFRGNFNDNPSAEPSIYSTQPVGISGSRYMSRYDSNWNYGRSQVTGHEGLTSPTLSPTALTMGNLRFKPHDIER